MEKEIVKKLRKEKELLKDELKSKEDYMKEKKKNRDNKIISIISLIEIILIVIYIICIINLSITFNTEIKQKEYNTYIEENWENLNGGY